MADDPFRLRVLKALTACLKEITPANGYRTDLSDFEATENGDTFMKARVYRGRNEFGSNDPRPMVSILEHPRALTPIYGTDDDTATHGGYELLIQGFANDDKDNPTDPAHVLAAEVVKRLVQEKARRTGKNRDSDPNILGLGFTMPCVTGIDVGTPIVRPADGEVSDVAHFFLSVTLYLVEDQEDPFA